jgi:hypothetical protein
MKWDAGPCVAFFFDGFFLITTYIRQRSALLFILYSKGGIFARDPAWGQVNGGKLREDRLLLPPTRPE